jgi:hypothetical protein
MAVEDVSSIMYRFETRQGLASWAFRLKKRDPFLQFLTVFHSYIYSNSPQFLQTAQAFLYVVTVSHWLRTA